MISAILIDDEVESLDALEYELNANCPNISIINKFSDTHEAHYFLQQNTIDVVFLDISMPSESGFEFLARQGKINFQIVFVTAYQDFALHAFDFYALAYLLKPVSKEKLIGAVERIKPNNTQNVTANFDRIEMLLNSFQKGSISESPLAVPTLEGFEMVIPNNIIYLEAEGNYTTLFLKTKQKIVVSKNLKEFERVLPESNFTRIHHSHIININCVKKYIKGDGGVIILENGQSLSVSRANKTKLLSLVRL